MKAVPTTIAVVAGVGLLFGGFTLWRPNGERPQVNTSMPREVVTPSASVAQKPLPQQQSAHDAAPAGSTSVHSKSAQVEKLRSSGSPVDAFAAYKILRACRLSRDVEVTVAQETDPVQKQIQAKWPRASEACGDLSPGQIAGRLQLLATAAKAGVHGAMTAFALEGPDGRGTADLNPSDATVVQWQDDLNRMTDAGVASGDPMSLLSRSNHFDNCASEACTNRDAAKALAYWVAFVDMQKLATGKEVPGANQTIDRLSRQMSQTQAAAAIAEGKQIAIQAQTSEKNK